MQFLYNLSVFFVGGLLKVLAIFSTKLKLFVSGRKKVFQVLEKTIKPTDTVLWIHCASLGEFEQGRPVIESLRKKYKNHKIVLTFFSPSGYEVQKNYEFADVVVYLPLDSVSNAKKFLKLVHPAVAIFVKYEFWPNYLRELEAQNIPTILVSGIFRKDQIFFKGYGKWMRNKLNSFSHFFVQDQNSIDLLHSMNLSNVSVSGDTRFDRVYAILKSDNSLDFIEQFVQNSHVIVAGSTWKEDEEKLVSYINSESSIHEKFIIAPHNIKEDAIQELKKSIEKNTVLYSEKEDANLKDFQVFIIDTIGILTKIYSKATVAYVGGGYTKSGVHNVLEPATFGIPVVIGPNYKKFKEAIDLVSLEGCIVTKDSNSVAKALKKFKESDVYRESCGQAAQNYIKSSLGASDKICKYIDSILK